MALVFDRAVLAAITRRLGSLHRRVLDAPGARRAAVFAPMCNVGGEASCLFTKRTDTVGTHKGQVSFPGGHVDPGETQVQAAQRELEEELGPTMTAASPLGMFHDATAVTGTLVTPVVGWVPHDMADMSQLRPSEGEVDEVFTLPFRHLLDESRVEWQSLDGRAQLEFRDVMVPVFHGGPARVWGLTAYMMYEIASRVVVPAFQDAGQLPRHARMPRPPPREPTE